MFNLMLSILFSFALLSCKSGTLESEPPRKSKWSWNCCSDAFAGTFTLTKEGTAITGEFIDSVANSGGAILGTFTADSIVFVRTWDTGSQKIELAITDNGQNATGVIFGSSLIGKRDMRAHRIE